MENIAESRSFSSFFFFWLFFFLLWIIQLSFTCLVILYRKQACWKHIWHDLSGSESGVCIEDFNLVAIWCISKCYLFVYCKGYQSIVWQCLSYLIYIYSSLNGLFYVFVWLFLVSMATDCTWWQATGYYNVNLGLISFCLVFLLLCTVIWRYGRLSITNL